MEVFPQIHCLELGWANAYLCVEDEGLTLIDAGSPGQARTVTDYILQIGRQPSELQQLLITHADWDHAGSAAAIQAETGALVLAGTETAHWLRQGRSPRHLPGPLHFIVSRLARYSPPTSIETFTNDDSLPLLGELRALATPGHTPDHYAFFSPATGVLFGGDALSTRGRKLRLPPNWLTGDVPAARRSAQRLLALTPALFACGHGPPLREHTLADVMKFLQGL